MIRLSAEIKTRSEFPELLVKHGLTRSAVEVGTMRGLFAYTILSKWPGVLHTIDPYVPTWEANRERTLDERMAKVSLAEFGDRVRMHQAFDSEKLADRIVSQTGRPDFVYIDADHKYLPCKKDIAIWWPRLADGGIMSGHDYTLRLPGVVRAINEFDNETEYQVLLTHEEDWKSWYVRKGPEGIVGDPWSLPIDKELLLDAAQ